MTGTDIPPILRPLGDAGLTVANPEADVRSRRVLDRDGEEVGTVDELLIDEQDRQVRLLRVAHGGFLGIGEEHVLVPVEAVTRIDEDHVHIDRTRDAMTDTPGYHPDLAEEPTYYTSVYDWWGYPPYWGLGAAPVGAARAGQPPLRP